MFRKILIALAVIVIALAGFVAMQPSEFRIERTATISASAPAVFAQVNDFHNWEAWSPWAKLDPAAKTSFEGLSAGTGAIFRWGRSPRAFRFLKPFRDTATTEFTFKPEGDQTTVTWSMAGENNFISKAACLFMDMDKMVGGKYEEGLATLKSLVEGAPSAQNQKEM